LEYWNDIKELRENVSSLSENFTSVNENLTLIHDNTQNLTNQTTTLFNTTSHLLENMTIVWQNISSLFDDVDLLQEWRDSVLADLGDLGHELDRLNSSMVALEAAHEGLLTKLDTLLASYESLNTTLTALTADVEALKASGMDLEWVEQNLTNIRSQIAVIEATLEGMPIMEDDIVALEALVAQAALDIANLTRDLATVEESIPDAYNDTALRDRIAQLEDWNELLKEEVDQLKEEQDNELQAKPDTGVVYTALLVGVLGLVVGVAALLSKRRA